MPTSRIGRLDDLERQTGREAAPVVLDRAGLVVALGEVDGPRLADPERARVQQRAQRGGVDAGDRDDDLGPLRQRVVVAELRHVGDRDAGLAQQAELEREGRASHHGREQRRLAEQLRDDDGHVAALALRDRPDLLEHRVEPVAVGGQDLEPRVAVGPVEEARADARVAARERHVDRAQRLLRDRLRVPERLAGGGVEPLDVEHDVVLDLAAAEDRAPLRAAAGGRPTGSGGGRRRRRARATGSRSAPSRRRRGTSSRPRPR